MLHDYKPILIILILQLSIFLNFLMMNCFLFSKNHNYNLNLIFDFRLCLYNYNVYVPQDDPDKHRNIEDHKMRQQMHKLMTAYPGVDFYHVSDDMPVPDTWRERPNFSRMSYREWVSYCDVQ